MQLAAPAIEISVVPPTTRAATPVDTRPLVPTFQHTLALARPDASGRHHVSAASGLAAAGGAAWVVSDEYGELVRYDRLDRPGTLWPGLPMPRKGKPDLEALLRVPQAGGGSLLVAFGSGSKANGSRSTALVQALDGAGARVGGPVSADLAPLYAGLAQRLPMGINVEGLALRDGAQGAELLVFHRGRLPGDANTIFRLDAARAIEALRGGRALQADLLLGQQRVDLGTLRGQPLGFADARALADGRIAFVASAEGEDGSGDGPVLGSVVGILDANLAVTVLRPLTGPARKVEGIELTRELDRSASATSFTLVTDPDDPSAAAEVLTVDLG
jgi:hypothetical protein